MKRRKIVKPLPSLLARQAADRRARRRLKLFGFAGKEARAERLLRGLRSQALDGSPPRAVDRSTALLFTHKKRRKRK
jgi:hypothetical protein